MSCSACRYQLRRSDVHCLLGLFGRVPRRARRSGWASRPIRATLRALRPTRRMTQRPARSVMTMRGAAIRKSSSVQLLLAQSGSAQRQRRLCHTRRVARPKTGRSIKTTPGRPFTWAITPRTGQPDIRLPVSRKVREMTLSRRHQPASRLRSKDDSEGATRCGKFLELLAETVGNLVPPTTALHSFASLGTKGAAKVCAHGECC